MQEGKTYALRLEIRSVSAESLIEGRSYAIKITKDLLERTIAPLRAWKKGELNVGEKVEFRIPSGELRRESKCSIEVLETQGQTSKECGRFEFLIMNYKNYSKSTFKMVDGERLVGVINMSINISSSQSQKNNERHGSKSQQKPAKKQQRKVVIQEPEVQVNDSRNSLPPEINIRAPVEQIKLVCPSERVREPKSMFSAFDGSGIVILTKKEVEREEGRRKSESLSSMGELFEKKTSVLKPPNDSLIKSCRLSPSRLQKDSRYCKEIQENLDNLSALDEESNRLSASRSPLKGEEDFSIFDTLHRMKDKFQKIHEHEGILNDERLEELTEVNEEETEEKDKLFASDNNNSNQYFIDGVKRAKSDQEPAIELGRSTIIHLEVHSQIADSHSSCHSRCRISRTVDLICPPLRPSLRITHCPTLQISVNPGYPLHETERDAPLSRRYRLAMAANLSAFQPVREESEPIKQPPTLSQSFLNFQIEEQSLQRFSYIKLNKISHLSRAADISKRRNNFLIKANEELKVAQRMAEQKLQISKKIISEKEDLLTHEFDGLREHMRIISNNLSLKNQQSLKREQKVKSLQTMVEQYVRDINCLKEDLKVKNTTIKDLRSLLSLKEETESKAPSRRDELPIGKSIREAMLEELGISKNLMEAWMQGGKKEELAISKNYTLGRREVAGKEERRGGDLLAEIFQSGANTINKTFVQQRKVRKYSSIENTVNNIPLEEQGDRSADQSNRTFRKFSHSKNSSMNAIQPQFSRQGGKINTNMDMVFEKLTGLFAGDSSGRVLKNL